MPVTHERSHQRPARTATGFPLLLLVRRRDTDRQHSYTRHTFYPSHSKHICLCKTLCCSVLHARAASAHMDMMETHVLVGVWLLRVCVCEMIRTSNADVDNVPTKPCSVKRKIHHLNLRKPLHVDEGRETCSCLNELRKISFRFCVH